MDLAGAEDEKGMVVDRVWNKIDGVGTGSGGKGEQVVKVMAVERLYHVKAGDAANRKTTRCPDGDVLHDHAKVKKTYLPWTGTFLKILQVDLVCTGPIRIRDGDDRFSRSRSRE